MSIKITSDSTCDLSRELLEEYGIDIVPLYVIKEGEAYKDVLEISSAEIFAYTDETGKLCSTSAVSQYDYSQVFEKLASEYDAVIHINISSDFSSCYQNACAAAAEMNNVYVIDSRNLSTGQGLIVLEAAKRARAGMPAAQIVEEVTALTGKVEASFLLDRLDYMVKGGRCSMVAALGANLLKLKPCIEVSNGKMRVCKKYRGAYAKCLHDYVVERLKGRDDLENERIFITYTGMADGTAEAVKNAVRENASFENITETQAGCTISCHCGPNTLGILFIRK